MSLTVQLYTMLSMIGMGAWTGAALDTYQRFLKRPKRKRVLIFFYDLLFWFVQALLIFYVLLLVNEATIRIYVFVALLCGFATYQSMFRRLYLLVLETGIKITIRVYRISVSITKLLIVNPVLFLVSCIVAIFVFLFRTCRSLLRVFLTLLIQIVKVVLKIFFVPIRLIGLVVWKVLPNRVKIFVKSLAGLLLKVEKFKVNIINWWISIKKWLGGPRE
ncbi:spore cortex biosynthesis protein YabQ [Ectobacillus sp. sgz5001026]|uniref:spore cortex biosynthesis protein YabQ n=1 Tax=Ectobacillus sp. sgz5001026 TaxID=3242473 RepID=UPI0036D3088F